MKETRKNSESTVMREILPHIYYGMIPAEESSQNDVNIFMLHAGGRTLFIDCGYDTASSLHFFEQVFRDFDIRPETTMLFLTHYHIDHVGMAWWFAQKGIGVYLHEEEYQDARRGLSRVRSGICTTCGFHESEIEILKRRIFDTRDYKPFFFDANPLKGGEILELGPYRLQTILLRGHTRGQLGLYEASAGLLFSGDHILAGIAPVILTEEMNQHFLRTYYRALSMVSSLNVHWLFPGHNAILTTPEEVDQVIRETQITYSHLCDTVLHILQNARQPLTAYQITLKLYHRQRLQMRRILGVRPYLMAQKVLSCLEYLHDQCQVERSVSLEQALLYEPASPSRIE